MFPLYAILDPDLLASRGLRPLDVLDAWLSAGVRLVQLRAKSLTSGPMLELADEMAARSRVAGATFIVNDRADVAALSGAEGVHVGQDDLSPSEVRPIVGATSVVGLSTHTMNQVERALVAPIDYVAIGPTFETSTKTSEWRAVGVAGVRDAVRVAHGRLPVVAIGGITLETAPDVLAAGAASVAVISDLLAGPVEARAQRYIAALRGI